MDPFDTPCWSALTTIHAGLADGGADAVRYPPDMSPFAALRADTKPCHDALAALLGADGAAALMLPGPITVPPGFSQMMLFPIAQMICEAPLPAPDPALAERMVPLGPDDAPDMLALADLAQPGPFRARTVAYGGFLGLRDGGTLVAMAGTRIRWRGVVEISGVCTHPAYRNRGYGAALTRAVGRAIQDGGDVPVMHVVATNETALRGYRAAGFVTRQAMVVQVLRRTGLADRQ